MNEIWRDGNFSREGARKGEVLEREREFFDGFVEIAESSFGINKREVGEVGREVV